MKDLALVRTVRGYEFATERDQERCKSHKIGDHCLANIKKPRNMKFHGKAFKMLEFAFEHYEAPENVEVDGVSIVVGRDFETFRKMSTVEAGYYTAAVSLDGLYVSLIPDSLSFEKMTEEQFENWYKAIRDVFWKLIFGSYAGWSEDEYLDKMAQFMEFG